MAFTGGPEDAAALEAGRRHVGMGYERLWMAYFALGGNHQAADVESWLRGNFRIPPRDFDLVALALNETLAEHERPYSVRYTSDM